MKRSNLPEAICSLSLSASALLAEGVFSDEVALAGAALGAELVRSPVLALLSALGASLTAIASVVAAAGAAAVCVLLLADWARAPPVAVSAKAAASAVPASR